MCRAGAKRRAERPALLPSAFETDGQYPPPRPCPGGGRRSAYRACPGSASCWTQTSACPSPRCAATSGPSARRWAAGGTTAGPGSPALRLCRLMLAVGRRPATPAGPSSTTRCAGTAAGWGSRWPGPETSLSAWGTRPPAPSPPSSAGVRRLPARRPQQGRNSAPQCPAASRRTDLAPGLPAGEASGRLRDMSERGRRRARPHRRGRRLGIQPRPWPPPEARSLQLQGAPRPVSVATFAPHRAHRRPRAGDEHESASGLAERLVCLARVGPRSLALAARIPAEPHAQSSTEKQPEALWRRGQPRKRRRRATVVRPPTATPCPNSSPGAVRV